MKRLITLLFAVTMIALSSKAITWDETFDYTETNLANVTAWTTQAGVTIGGTGRNIVSGGLIYSNAGGDYVHSNVGKTLYTDITSTSASYPSYRAFSQTAINSGVVYLSFLFNPCSSAMSSSGVEILGLADGTSNNGPKVWFGKTTGVATTTTFKFGTARATTTIGNVNWGETAYSIADNLNTVFLIVLKYDFTTQKTKLFVNPIIGTSNELSATVESTDADAAKTKLNNVWFRATGSGTTYRYNISGVRVSYTWADAVEATVVPTEAILTLIPLSEGGSIAVSPVKAGNKYNIGDEVIITATPTGNYQLKNFVVNGVNTAATPENSLTLRMDENKTVTAVFEDPTALPNTEWVINPLKPATNTWGDIDIFVEKNNTTKVGTPLAGHTIYLSSGQHLKINSSIPKLTIEATAATVEILGASASGLEGLSLNNSILLSNTSSTTLRIGTLTLAGNNTINISKSLQLGVVSTGEQSPIIIQGSGVITKMGAEALRIAPNTDLTKTTFSGTWEISQGEISTNAGSTGLHISEFLPGPAININAGAKYSILRMNKDFFESGSLNQIITIKQGGILNVTPQIGNALYIMQEIIVNTGGTFNINAIAGTVDNTKKSPVTFENDITLYHGAIHNISYKNINKDNLDILTVKNLRMKVLATITPTPPLSAVGNLVPPLVNYNPTDAQMPTYTGNIIVDLTFDGSTNAVDFTQIFPLVIPTSYTNDILLEYTPSPGEYVMTLPSIPANNGNSWMLYDNGALKVDLAANSPLSYTTTLSSADMRFKWGISTVTSVENINNNANVVDVRYYTLTGIEIQQPTSGIFIKKTTYNNGAVETTKIFKK